jgi:DNA-binding LacI/PurR family transcriptional regulator
VPVSIKDIAQKANVSPSTVSRALNDHPRISTETKKQIQELARSMGYVPSQAARNLVTQRSATIGVAVADYLDPFYVSLLGSIEDVALANNYDLFVSSFYRDRKREEKMFDNFYEKRLAGIIVAGSLIDEEYLHQNKHLIPVVLVNCVSYPFSVSVDKLAGAQIAMNHLIALGHHRIAYVSQDIPFNTEFLRLEGYRAVLSEHGIPVDDALIVPGDGSIMGGIQAVERLLDLGNPPTAIFCFNDMTAIGVIHALHQCGYDIPNDFSVIGFDDLEIAAYYHPPLTTIHQPIYNLGHRSATMLFELIQGQEHIQSETLKPALVIRGSTARARIRAPRKEAMLSRKLSM